MYSVKNGDTSQEEEEILKRWEENFEERVKTREILDNNKIERLWQRKRKIQLTDNRGNTRCSQETKKHKAPGTDEIPA